MGNVAKSSDKSDASAKNEVTSTPKADQKDVSNTLIENQWNRVKTNIDNLREDATTTSKSPNSLDHLDQYFTEVDVPKISSFTKGTDSGKKDKIKETLVFINDMEKEIDSLIDENKKHDAFLDLTRQEKNKIQKVFTNLMQDQSKQQETPKPIDETNGQKKDEVARKTGATETAEDLAPRYLTYLNQLKKDKINKQNDSTVTGEKRKLQKKAKSQIFAELVGGEKAAAAAPKKEEPTPAKKSSTKSKKKGKKAAMDVTREAAKIAENFMDDSYVTLDSMERSKARHGGGKSSSEDGGMGYDSTPAKLNDYGGGLMEGDFSSYDYAEAVDRIL